MRLASVLVAIASILSAFTSPAGANSESGVGVIIQSELLFTAAVGTGDRSWFVFAYQTEDLSSTEVYVYEMTSSVGLAEPDQASVEASAISLSRDEQTGLWHLNLDVTLPRSGLVDLEVISDQAFGSDASTALGWWSYHLESPSRGLSGWGNVVGSVGGQTITGFDTLAWGVDVSGTFIAPPIGSEI